MRVTDRVTNPDDLPERLSEDGQAFLIPLRRGEDPGKPPEFRALFAAPAGLAGRDICVAWPGSITKGCRLS